MTEVAAVTPQPDPARPSADTPVALLKSDADGVELLPGTAPEVTDRIALDTITYSDEGEVRLAGRAQAQASSVRVYLDNRSVGALEVDPQGRWRGDIEDIKTGIYTLRVDELDQGGDRAGRGHALGHRPRTLWRPDALCARLCRQPLINPRSRSDLSRSGL